jgi:DNA polymerase III epsilon subunit-like protein
MKRGSPPTAFDFDAYRFVPESKLLASTTCTSVKRSRSCCTTVKDTSDARASTPLRGPLPRPKVHPAAVTATESTSPRICGGACVQPRSRYFNVVAPPAAAATGEGDPPLTRPTVTTAVGTPSDRSSIHDGPCEAQPPLRQLPPQPLPAPAPAPHPSSPLPLAPIFVRNRPPAQPTASSSTTACDSLREPVGNDAYYRSLLPKGTAWIVFDTETTGLGKRSTVVQMALGFFDGEGTVLQMYNRLWKPPKGIRISKASERIHGLSNSMVMKNGAMATAELISIRPIFRAAKRCRVPIVAFNAKFDCRLLSQTANAFGLDGDFIDPSWVTCTYELSRAHCPLRTLDGKRKGFRNAELFTHFFHSKPDVKLHDAVGDVKVTEACYRRGREKRWW